MGRRGFFGELGSYVRGFFSNWRESEDPVGAKVRKAMKNRARALRRGCCGHPHEPGC